MLSREPYRDGRLICSRVGVTVISDVRLGLVPRERRRLIRARFTASMDPTLRDELTAVVRRRGAAARRAAERMEPISIVLDGPGDSQITGRVLPPQVRSGGLREIEFGLREPRS